MSSAKMVASTIEFGYIAIDDTPRQSFGQSGLADPGIAHIKGIVLGPPAQDLHGPFDFRLAPDQGVDLAFARLLVEIHAISVERLPAAPIGFFAGLLFLGGACLALFIPSWHLGDAVRRCS